VHARSLTPRACLHLPVVATLPVQELCALSLVAAGESCMFHDPEDGSVYEVLVLAIVLDVAQGLKYCECASQRGHPAMPAMPAIPADA
jgi:hypothetical protein